MKRFSVFLVILFIITIFIGCGDTNAEKTISTSSVADFELKDINGRTLKLSSHKGKVIILNFFATWCPPCRMEMPDFNEIAKDYKGKVEIIGVNVGRESLAKVREFVKSYDLKFTIAIDDGTVSQLYGPIRAIPVSVVIDKDFNIAKRYIGARPKEIFIEDIEALSK